MKTLDKSLLMEVEAYYLKKEAYTAPPPPGEGGLPPFMNQNLEAPMAGGAPMGAPPMGGDPMGAPPMGGDPMAGGAPGGDPMAMIMEAVAQGRAEGIPDEQIVEELIASGVPMELIEQVMMQAPPPEEGAAMESPMEPPPELIDIRSMMDEEIKAEREKRTIPPEELIQIHDKKIEILTRLVQDLMDQSIGKQASYKKGFKDIIEALEYEG